MLTETACPISFPGLRAPVPRQGASTLHPSSGSGMTRVSETVSSGLPTCITATGTPILGLHSGISSKTHSMVNSLLVYEKYMGTDRYDVA